MTEEQRAHLDKLKASATHPSVPEDEQGRAKRRFIEVWRRCKDEEALETWKTESRRVRT